MHERWKWVTKMLGVGAAVAAGGYAAYVVRTWYLYGSPSTPSSEGEDAEARELILGSTPADGSRLRGIVEQTRALGWVVLREVVDREIVMGAVTKPAEEGSRTYGSVVRGPQGSSILSYPPFRMA